MDFAGYHETKRGLQAWQDDLEQPGYGVRHLVNGKAVQQAKVLPVWPRENGQFT